MKAPPNQEMKLRKPRKGKEAVAAGPALLAGGNPRIPKADGDAPVQAYIAAMPGWKRDIGRRLDALVASTVPGVRKAVRWNSPFYGLEGQGWFLGFHVFTHYVKVTFFRGTSLRPVPPGDGQGRALDRRPRGRSGRAADGGVDPPGSRSARLGQGLTPQELNPGEATECCGRRAATGAEPSPAATSWG